MKTKVNYLDKNLIKAKILVIFLIVFICSVLFYINTL